MKEEDKIKWSLFRVFCAICICMLLGVIKFVFKQEELIETVYNYMITDIVFQG